MDEPQAEGISRLITEKLEYWKEATVNIAVVGRSGSGKSSFINTIRRLTGDDEGAARVGSTQTTMTETSYAFPENPNLKLTDLPGMGTVEFPRETYLEIFNKDQNDCFVIIYNTRLSEDETWLAGEIMKMKKPFYFVRSHIDNDIKNERYDQRDQISKEEVFTKMREKIEKLLPKMDRCVDIYLVDCLEITTYDFPKLVTDILDNLPSHKQEAMIRSMKPIGKLIEKKASQSILFQFHL
jgi:predicted GTPase